MRTEDKTVPGNAEEREVLWAEMEGSVHSTGKWERQGVSKVKKQPPVAENCIGPQVVPLEHKPTQKKLIRDHFKFHSTTLLQILLSYLEAESFF